MTTSWIYLERISDHKLYKMDLSKQSSSALSSSLKLNRYYTSSTDDYYDSNDEENGFQSYVSITTAEYNNNTNNNNNSNINDYYNNYNNFVNNNSNSNNNNITKKNIKKNLDLSSLPKIIKVKKPKSIKQQQQQQQNLSTFDSLVQNDLLNKTTQQEQQKSTLNNNSNNSNNNTNVNEIMKDGIKNAIIQSIFSSSVTATSVNTNNLENQNNNKDNNIIDLDKQQSEEISTTTTSNTKKKRSKKSKEEQEIDYDLLEQLTPEQENIVNMIVEGKKNVFFTGSAGTGKSFVLKHIVNRLRQKHENQVYVTAATGIAAVNIGGVTLHSFAGIKMGQGTIDQLTIGILKSKLYSKRWTEAKVLVIDEISMINADLFEKLDAIAKVLRFNDEPFGGIQLVLSGDFFQLPPVVGKYVFESDVWTQCIHSCVELTTVMRQKEEKFVNILNELRKGKVLPESIKVLEECSRPLDVSNGVLPTKLYTINQQVDDENSRALEELPGDPITFTSLDSGHEEMIEILERDCPAPQRLTLKVGAQVVLLRKLKSTKLVNGSRGVVVDFIRVPKPKKSNQLAGYYESNVVLPVVLFNDGTRVTIKPADWNIWSEKRATRLQIPLKLAWALTIHRAQGMTLDKVECKLEKTFANGQGYVALSRVKTLDGLYLEGFNRSSIRTSLKAIQFEKKYLKPLPPPPKKYNIKY